MPRTGARFSSNFSKCSARERDFLENFQDAPHGSAIFFEIFRMLRTGARFCSIWTKIDQRNFEDVSSESAIFEDKHQNDQNAPHGSEILLDWAGDKSMKFRGCLERERDFLQKRMKHFPDAPHRNAIFTDLDENKSTKFRGCLDPERD